MVSRGRPSLQAGLDKEIYQIVRKYLDEKNESPLKLRSSTVYDWLQRSNSSLKRRPKKQLEDSIERVIDVIREDESDDEDEMADLEGDFAGNLEEKPAKDRSGDWMNKQIVNQWATKESVPTNGEKEKSEKSKKRELKKTDAEREAKRQKKAAAAESKIDVSPPSGVSLKDLGGVDQVKKQLKEHLVLPLLCPEEYSNRKIPIPRGILLHGPPGCGKTMISRAFAARLGVPFLDPQSYPACLENRRNRFGSTSRKLRRLLHA
jgi:ribosome biogenesis ATPase